MLLQCAGMRPAPLPFAEEGAPEGSLAVARRDVIAPSKAIAVRPADTGVHTASVSAAEHARACRAGPDCASTEGTSGFCRSVCQPKSDLQKAGQQAPAGAA